MKIIMISLDTLRADRLGCYGHHLPTSPYIDKIASEGVLFENAFASDIPTEVAHTSIFTGKRGLTTGIVSHGSQSSYLPKGTEWLPNMLRKSGFTTGAVDNLYHLKEWFARGYQYYINSIGEKRWIDGRTVNDLAKPWIKEHKNEDFFLFLHYWDPHTPYLPPKNFISEFYDIKKDPFDPTNKSMERAYNHPAYPFFKLHHFDLLGPVTDAEYINALYDAEIRYLDDLLLELDQYLESEGIIDDTLIVLVGDHGESLTEHDIYWDHCGLYDTTVHVPLIIRWPNQLPANKRINQLVQHVDIMPTILELIGEDIPNDLDGKTLLPLIRGSDIENYSEIFLSECAWQASRGIRTKEYKFIQTYDSGPFNRPEYELYDINNDADEKCNIAKDEPQLLLHFQEKLDKWVQSTLGEREDPMEYVIREEGLPFRRRIEKTLKQFNLTWKDWMEDPRKERIDGSMK